MLIVESLRRQEELKAHLYDMASAMKEDEELREIAIKLKGLYTDGFRHVYSEFFALIVEIAKDDNAYSLDFLSNNITNVRALVEQDYVDGEKEFRGLYKPLTKLSDHINLEIARYSYSSIHEQRVLDLEKRNKNLQTELADATEKLGEAQKSMSSVQTELIAVLSIFAAIVLTFSGSMSLLGNALTGMENAPFFKSVFFVLLCGFVITNVIFLMMYLVGKITGRNIYAKCKSKDCTCGEGGVPKCCGLTRVRKRLPYVFWINFLVILMMVIDVAVWYFDKLYNIIP
ncbi:MAG: hypothetical protein IJN07_03025 [Clostridia bacterium]|nr:hypothetical protein [Clostridia bacterium]